MTFPNKELMNTYGIKKNPFVFIINYKMDTSFVWGLHEIPKNILFEFPHFKNHYLTNTNNDISIDKTPITLCEYEKAFSNIQKHLQRGDSFLINLTTESGISTKASLKDIFRNSNAPYKLLFKDNFVVFSPEPFIQIKKNVIKTFPMKGTINANIPNAEELIQTNKKEMAEHATIVDLLRNDLSIVANNVKVDSYRYSEKIKTNSDDLIQISSCISGDISDEYTNKIGDIIYSLLPAGSISGAPKKKTCEIIEQTETHNRGFYTGIMGYFDGENLESAVMIRFIEKKNNQLFYKSGGGITSQSIVEEEYQELIQKIYVPIY